LGYLDERLKKELEAKKAKGTLRELFAMPSAAIDLTSNDYLGLASSVPLREFLNRSIQMSLHRTAGATGSRLLSGNHPEHEHLEDYLSKKFKSERCLLFNSGYQANLGFFSSVPKRDETILYDEKSHACVKDGIRLSLANGVRFKHNDLKDLDRKLAAASGKCYIAVESIYSMEGDLCPLDEVVSLAEKYEAAVILDEAHATGLFDEGSGYATARGLEDKIFARIYTFGKALAYHGACIAGSALLCNYLVNTARAFIYTTALPPAAAHHLLWHFKYLEKEGPGLRAQLASVIEYFGSYAREIDLEKWLLLNDHTPIQALMTKSSEKARKISIKLANEGYFARPIVAPTVPEGTERIRIVLHANHKRENITGFLDAIKKIMT
jgi:8-amino-7-oxononanoate synthase